MRHQVTERRKKKSYFWTALVVQPDLTLTFAFRDCSNKYHSDRNILERDGWRFRMGMACSHLCHFTVYLLYYLIAQLFFVYVLVSFCMLVNIRTMYQMPLMQTRANDAYDSGEDGYDSSRDEISSVSSYPNKGNLNRTFGSSLSLNSGPRLSMKDTSYIEERVGSSPKMMVSQLSAAVVTYDSATGK